MDEKDRFKRRINENLGLHKCNQSLLMHMHFQPSEFLVPSIYKTFEEWINLSHLCFFPRTDGLIATDNTKDDVLGLQNAIL